MGNVVCALVPFARAECPGVGREEVVVTNTGCHRGFAEGIDQGMYRRLCITL